MKGERYYIVGPCAAESREQVLETAKQIADCFTDRPFALTDRFTDRPATPDRLIFRAGVWKPRTNPNTFQGAGEKALEWLQEVRERYGFPVATEVATPEHVEAALQAGIDYLWIGARTSANPIAVQAISHQLSAASCPPKTVLIKNPVNADAALWLGNIERLERTGIPVIAVHRGCNHKPCWSMAHEVRLQRPDIPMLLDPSHMSGDATQVPGLIFKIEELGLDGAMIEVHNKPSEALSDAKQQINPEGLAIVEKVERKKSKEKSPATNELELAWLRAEIDELDERLWETIAARMEVSRRIGAWKKAQGMPPLQPERYHTIVERINALANERGFSNEFALRLYDLIHAESLIQQQ